MAIVAADLEAWGCASEVTDDTSTHGGIIQDDIHATGGVGIEFTDISATGLVEVISDGADTRTITVYGRLASGAIDNEDIVVNGATPVAGVKSFERILSAYADAKNASRTVTVRKATDDVTIGVIGINGIGFRRRFYDAASEAGATTRYELTYLKNSHATLSLNSANVQLSADPEGVLEIALANAKGDVGTITNRKTLPTGIGSWTDDATDVAVPTGALAAGERIAVWARQVLSGGYAAFKNTFTLQLSGTTAP
jgi:hypothetical protein